MEYPRTLPPPRGRFELRILTIGAILFGLLMLVRWGSSLLIDYEWWKEVGQVQTWIDLYAYTTVPVLVAALLAGIVLWWTHARALKFAGTGLGEHPIYARITALGALFVGWILASATLDSWTVVRYLGSRDLSLAPNAWHDPIFNQPLDFYLFDLPFYDALRHYIVGVIVAAIAIYWIAARVWQMRLQFHVPTIGPGNQLDLSFLKLSGGLESRFVRIAGCVLLLAMAVKFYLGRFEMVWNEHGFMTGIDYTDATVGLPLQWLLIIAALAGAALVALGRWLPAAAMVLAVPIAAIVPGIFSSLYVKPNEISLEAPYIDSHIKATRVAYGLESSVEEVPFHTTAENALDLKKHDVLLSSVRLWDWRPFHDTVTQTQALRPYYVFNDTDVDRYKINGVPRQVLLSPRELDIAQLPMAARSSWVNQHFTYTHGYGVVLADVNKITEEGLPNYLIENMPLQIKTPDLKVVRPELYFGEKQTGAVYVHTSQEEATGADEQSHYEGAGGFPMSSLGMRLAAAVDQGDANIVLTGYLTPNSRMMIHRQITDRLDTLADFLVWDSDPYLVITAQGRLVWIVDGYTVSNAHPYARRESLGDLGSVNYMRNAVKATIDAYDGTTRLYVFAPQDPIIRSYRKLFPALFLDAKEMPADLRAHTRYPETLFRVQAEMYRTYHITNPGAFYNKEDLWDLSRFVSGQGGHPEVVSPTYQLVTLPGQARPEFVLSTSFTPLGKQNLSGVMIARCDGDKLGELKVLTLSKQEMINGPMMISAHIDQDQNISKDLTLWNQQGSQVIRGQVLVLPVDNTFLYVEPIYLQANQAKMPQLKKIVLALGNRLVYENTYEEALADLSGGTVRQTGPKEETISGAPSAPVLLGSPNLAQSIRDHLRHYKELVGEGRMAEAGKELEAIESAVK